MESINFTDCIYTKSKNNTQTHEATITICKFEMFGQVYWPDHCWKGRKAMQITFHEKGEILEENINWKFLHGVSKKPTVVLRGKGKYGCSWGQYKEGDKFSFIKCRIGILQIWKSILWSQPHQYELVTASIDSEEARSNLVMAEGGMQGTISMVTIRKMILACLANLK